MTRMARQSTRTGPTSLTFSSISAIFENQVHSPVHFLSTTQPAISSCYMFLRTSHIGFLSRGRSDSWDCFFGHKVPAGSGSGNSDLLLREAAGENGLPVGCKPHAASAVMIYVVSYGINVYSCMALVKEMSAVFCVVFGAMVVPGDTYGSLRAPLSPTSTVALLACMSAHVSLTFPLSAFYPIAASVIGFSFKPLVDLYHAGIPMPITWNVGLGAALCVVSLFVFKGDLFVEMARRR